MSLSYEITTGKMYSGAGKLLATGYSGQPPHVNDIAAVGEVGIGPIPPGSWRISEIEWDNPRLGPFVLVLEPDPATTLYVLSLGRGSHTFRIHGEREQPPPGYASDGCIVLPRAPREQIWNLGDHELNTIATLKEESQ
jgi:hypothetical protein